MEQNENFTKANIREGDILVRHIDGDSYAEITLADKGWLICEDGAYDLMDELTDDLLFICDGEITHDGEIDKIYRPYNPAQCSFKPKDYMKGELVYDRQNQVEILTVAQAELALSVAKGKTVKII